MELRRHNRATRSWYTTSFPVVATSGVCDDNHFQVIAWEITALDYISCCARLNRENAKCGNGEGMVITFR